MNLVIPIVLFFGGLAILIFRKKIGVIYDRNAYLTEKEKTYYKNVVLRIVGFILLLGGTGTFALTFLPDAAGSWFADFYVTNFPIIEIIFGCILIFLAVLILIAHIFKKASWLMNLGPMKKVYGTKKGSIVHIIGYIVFPLAFGISLIIIGLISL